ncbi:MAG: hypothetical protein ACE5HA_13455, partial [Anaerolineae bacterium]
VGKPHLTKIDFFGILLTCDMNLPAHQNLISSLSQSNFVGVRHGKVSRVDLGTTNKGAPIGHLMLIGITSIPTSQDN